MEQKTAAELCVELNTDPSFVEATIGLDTGRLLKSTTHVYFIAPRMGGWEVIEQTALSELSKVEKKTNFIGETFVVHTKSGRWTCKDVTENVDLRQWVLQKARSGSIAASGLHQTSEASLPPASETVSTRRSEWSDSSSSIYEPVVPTDDFFANPASPISRSNWSDAAASINMSTEQEDLNEELQSVFEHVTISPSQPEPRPVERNAEVDALLEKLASTTDEDGASGSSCGGNLVKLFIFIWIFGMFTDLC